MKRHLLPPRFFTVRLPTRLALFWRAHFSGTTIAEMGRKPPLSFLIFRLDALGDVVMTTPLLRALKTAYPRSRCTVVVQKSYKSLLATNPHIDEVLTLPHIRPAWLPRGTRRLLAALLFYRTQLRKRYFDFAISPRWDADEHLATFLCVLTNTATRVGYSETTSATKQQLNRGFDRAYDICLPPGPVQHEVLRNLAVAEELGAKSSDGTLEVQVTEQDRKQAARLLAEVPRGAKMLAIGMGAGSPGRRWPLERYAEVTAELVRQYRLWPVIVGSSAELPEAEKLAALVRSPLTMVSGARLREVCAVLEHCELFIGNDSGCAHLAAAMGCTVIVISRHPRQGDANHFNSPVRFRPYGRQVRVLQPAVGLDGCRTACHRLQPHCINQVSVPEVVDAARELLCERPALVASGTADERTGTPALHPPPCRPGTAIPVPGGSLPANVRRPVV